MAMTNLSLLLKEISEAIRLDNENNEKEAYKRYVECIFAIASNLMEALKAEGGEVVVNHTLMKQVKLIQQCTDRVAELIKTISLTPVNSQSQSPTPSALQQSFTESRSGNEGGSHFYQKPLSVPQFNQYSNTGSIKSIATVGTSQAEDQCGGFNDPVPALPTENNPHAVVALKSRSLTPMEIASKQNQSLMVAFKARMLRLNRSDFNAYNYSLAIQRKMMENIAIARAQEEELARKMQARNQRLEQEAAKRFSVPSGMSEEEKEQKNIYKKILEYENEAHWLKQWRQKLTEKPEDPVMICQLVQEVLRCSDHPITELLKQYQFKIYQRLFPLVQKRTKKLAQIKVPLSDDLWPVYEDVKDVVGDVWENRETFEEGDPEEEGLKDGLMSKSNLSVSSLKEETIADDHSKLGDKQCDIPPFCNTSSNDNVNLYVPAVVNSVISPENKNCKTENEIEDLSTSRCILEHAEGDKTKSKEGTPQGGVKRRKQIASWERKQAKLLMKQVTKRCALQACVNVEEDDDLDYLFDDEDEEATEIMYSSISYTRTSPEINVPVDEENRVDENQHPSRSVSHEFQSSFLEHQDSSAMYQSLPYSSYKERAAEFEEAKKIAKLSHEACESHLKTICEDIHHYLEKLLVLMTIAYQPLDTPVGKDQCAVSLEEPFFKPIWKSLLLLFRVVNFRQEQVLACVMTKYRFATPGDLNVNKKLWLTSDPGQLPSSKNSIETIRKPYEKAVTELKRVGDHYTMLSKLECIVKVCRLICECVDDHYGKSQQGGGKKAPSIGADDLVPILCYVVIQSATPQLASECQAMAEFIQEGYLMGEEGYCLTTLRTALTYVTSLFSKS